MLFLLRPCFSHLRLSSLPSSHHILVKPVYFRFLAPALFIPHSTNSACSFSVALSTVRCLCRCCVGWVRVMSSRQPLLRLQWLVASLILPIDVTTTTVDEILATQLVSVPKVSCEKSMTSVCGRASGFPSQNAETAGPRVPGDALQKPVCKRNISQRNASSR